MIHLLIIRTGRFVFKERFFKFWFKVVVAVTAGAQHTVRRMFVQNTRGAVRVGWPFLARCAEGAWGRQGLMEKKKIGSNCSMKIIIT